MAEHAERATGRHVAISLACTGSGNYVGPVDFRVLVEPELGASYSDQRAVARAAEDMGFSGFFRSDHYLAVTGNGLPGPTDSWVTLAGLARETTTIRLGTMVTSATFRYPGPLAISVAQVDAMSAGRVEFGIGTGWLEEEHRAYGIPFPPLSERFDRLTEQLEILTGLWSVPPGETFDYQGRFYTLSDSPALPKPTQRPYPPIIVGGLGAKRTPVLAARFASEFNLPGVAPPAAAGPQLQRVADAVAAAGRPRDSIDFSAVYPLCIGRTNADIARRADAVDQLLPGLAATSPLKGAPENVVDRCGELSDLGIDRVYAWLLDIADIAQLELLATEVVPHLH